jgi:hypothetical protein
LEVRNGKHPIANKLQGPKLRISKERFGHWIFGFGNYLEVVVWDLEFTNRGSATVNDERLSFSESL